MARFIKRFKRMGLVKKVVCIALAIGTTVGSVFGVKAIVEKVKDDQKTIHPTFAVGGLASSNGEYEDNKDTIYTKDAFSAKGLNIKLDFDSTVQYQVFFYDELGNFAYTSDVMDKGSEFYTPANYTVRLEVTPEFDNSEDNEIDWHEVYKYANQLEVRVDKNQDFVKSDYVGVKVPSNVFEVKLDTIVNENGVVQAEEGFTTYTLVNDGSFSLCYVEYDDEAMYVPEYGGDPIYPVFTVTLSDGTLFKRFCARGPQSDMPTLPEPLFIPKGASIHVAGSTGTFDDLKIVMYFA